VEPAPPQSLLLLLLLQMLDTLVEILSANGATGSVNLYMAAGGTSEWHDGHVSHV
jgi:hypothetical protein